MALPPGFQIDDAQSKAMGFTVAVNPATGQRMRPKAAAGPKARPEWGTGAFEMPDGSIVRQGPRGGSTVLQGPTKQSDAPADIKEFQANAAARATLMDQGLTDYEKARESGYDPNNWKNLAAGAVENVWGVGPFAANVIRDNPSEQGRAAELQFTDGALRTTSGANAPEPEVRRASKAYFQQPGESTGVEPNKAELRHRFRDQSVRIAGPAYIAPKNPMLEVGAPAAPPAAAGPKRKPLPAAARDAHQSRLKAGMIDLKQARGTRANPFVARSADLLDRLPPGSWAISPDGDLGVVE